MNSTSRKVCVGIITVVAVVLAVHIILDLSELRELGESLTGERKPVIVTPQLPSCVVDSCTDFWDGPGGPADVNMDFGGCAHVRHMVNMSTLKANISAHWCKAWLAAERCRSRRYRWMLFRDEDTILDVPKLIDVGVQSAAPLIISKKSNNRVVTNWFLLDTYNENVCSNIQRWWGSAVRDHPEHDQKYFNLIFRCGVNGTLCFDKTKNLFQEVHCRSSLGRASDRKRQSCMRYQIETQPHLLR